MVRYGNAPYREVSANMIMAAFHRCSMSLRSNCNTVTSWSYSVACVPSR
jgi:hypothetical protein